MTKSSEAGGYIGAVAVAGGGLDTHRERSDPGAWGPLCDRVSGRYVLTNGEAVAYVRCGNRRCASCDLREALELGRVLSLDALLRPVEGLLTLTTADPADSHRSEKFRRSFEQVVKALRRRWPGLEYLAFIEFTSGLAPSSGGYQRQHAHVLLRGLGGADLEAVRAVASEVWCARMGTANAAQDIRPINGPEGLMHYLAHHHRKPGQAPPEWWSGKRTRSSRGWWSRPIAELRQEAAEQLRQERVRWIAEQRVRAAFSNTQSPEEFFRWDALVAVEFQRLELERAVSRPWRLWHVGADADGVPRLWFPVPLV